MIEGGLRVPGAPSSGIRLRPAVLVTVPMGWDRVTELVFVDASLIGQWMQGGLFLPPEVVGLVQPDVQAADRSFGVADPGENLVFGLWPKPVMATPCAFCKASLR
jgi:hypothetical protein